MPDLGLFGPDSVSWRVHREPILALAGLRALFLQSLHPQAMAGVAQNSIWSELLAGECRAAGRRLRAIHSRMRAVDHHTGETFRVDEPHLLRWVHITEVESFVTTAKRAGMKLSDAEVDTYYDEQRRAAALVGLDPETVPGNAREVADFYRDVQPQLAMTTEAAESALFLSAPPMPYRLGFTPARLAWFGLAAVAVGLLPTWARRLYGLPGLPTTGPAAALSARSLRLALKAVPDKALRGPIYEAAMARVADAGLALPA